MTAPRRRPRDADATRQDILDAALALFARRGYRGTSIAAIAAGVGVTDAAVLYHYATKPVLFDAVVDYFASLQAERFLELIEPNGLPAIRNLARWGEVMQARPDLLRLQVILSAEALTEDSEMHDYFTNRYQQLHALLASIFQHGIDDGDIHPDTDVDHEVAALLAHLDGARLIWLYDHQRRPLAADIATYVEQLVERITKPTVEDPARCV